MGRASLTLDTLAWPDVATGRLLAVPLGATEQHGSHLPLDDLRRGGVRAVSPSGVLGDPAGASADEGHRLLDTLAEDLVAAVAAWTASPC